MPKCVISDKTSSIAKLLCKQQKCFIVNVSWIWIWLIFRKTKVDYMQDINLLLYK